MVVKGGDIAELNLYPQLGKHYEACPVTGAFTLPLLDERLVSFYLVTLI